MRVWSRSAAVPAPAAHMVWHSWCSLKQFLSATTEPSVARVSAASTTPSVQTTPQIVVPVFFAWGGRNDGSAASDRARPTRPRSRLKPRVPPGSPSHAVSERPSVPSRSDDLPPAKNSLIICKGDLHNGLGRNERSKVRRVRQGQDHLGGKTRHVQGLSDNRVRVGKGKKNLQTGVEGKGTRATTKTILNPGKGIHHPTTLEFYTRRLPNLVGSPHTATRCSQITTRAHTHTHTYTVRKWTTVTTRNATSPVDLPKTQGRGRYDDPGPQETERKVEGSTATTLLARPSSATTGFSGALRARS